MRLRKTNLDDLPQLKALWALGFGDTEQEIEAFFAISYPVATGFCAEEDGRLIAAAYALPQELAWGERTAKAAYLYAVTTHPDFRAEAKRRRIGDGKKCVDLPLGVAEAQRPKLPQLRDILGICLADAHQTDSFQSATYFSSSTVGWYDSFARRRPSEPMSSSRLRNCTSGYFSAIMRENSRLIMA